MIKKYFIASIILLSSVCIPSAAYSQDKIIIEPLFEYPSAPEELEGLTERSDYLMDHFWDSFDFKVPVVDQTALNDAFGVFVTAMRYASRDKSLASINKLIKSLKGNSTLLYQFTKAAEDNLYGPRAAIWSDEAYIPFLKALTAEKSISDIKKQRYSMQLETLLHNAPGVKFPKIRLTLANGRHSDFEVKHPLTLIEFGNPDCDDCKFSRLKLEMAADIAEMIKSGELGMYFIVADAMPEDQSELIEKFADYPAEWITAINYGGDEIFDLRSTPSFYLLDKNGKIIAKNIDVNKAVEVIRSYQK